MQCDVGSCVGGRGTRSFHSGSGRSCCRHGRRAFPVKQPISITSYNLSSWFPHSANVSRCCCRAKIFFLTISFLSSTNEPHQGIVVPFQGRFSRRRRCLRKYACWRRLRNYLSVVVDISLQDLQKSLSDHELQACGIMHAKQAKRNILVAALWNTTTTTTTTTSTTTVYKAFISKAGRPYNRYETEYTKFNIIVKLVAKVTITFSTVMITCNIHTVILTHSSTSTEVHYFA